MERFHKTLPSAKAVLSTKNSDRISKEFRKNSEGRHQLASEFFKIFVVICFLNSDWKSWNTETKMQSPFLSYCILLFFNFFWSEKQTSKFQNSPHKGRLEQWDFYIWLPQNKNCTRAIITRGLYIFYPIFQCGL